ncbi:MAG: hypothetical protein ACYDCD_08255 [Candidatus Acidiferrales bacterium]
MISKFKFVPIAVGLFVFVAGSALPAMAAPPTDACSLLTATQVSAVLEVPAAGKSLSPKACMWVQTGVKPGSPRRRADLVILIMQGYSLAKTPNSRTSVTPVSGLGDDAYYFAMTSGQYMELRVKKGSVVFGIRVHRSGTPFTPVQIKAKEKTLAQGVLAKL